MLKTIIVAENPLIPESWETHSVDDIELFLLRRFPSWPESARIYHRQVAQENDVTPFDEASAERLKQMDGLFYIVVYPAATVTIITIIAVAAAVAAAYFFRPKVPNPEIPDTSQSINNALSDRQNSARPSERIPDIFGKIRVTPDLIAVPYRIFKYNTEYEYSYLCIGRGSYELSEFREDKTPIDSTVSLRIFGPNTNPNTNSPERIVGDDFNEPVSTVIRHSSVENLQLRPPNILFTRTARFVVRHNGQFADTATITLDNVDEVTESFLDYFHVGGTLKFEDFWVTYHDPYTLRATMGSLDDNYEVVAVTHTTVTIRVINLGRSEYYLNSSEGTYDIRWCRYFHEVEVWNGNTVTYNLVADRSYTIGAGNGDHTIQSGGYKWVGPFKFDSPDCTEIISNFVADRGLYKETGSTRYAIGVAVRLELTPIDANGIPIGAVQNYDTVLTGSSSRVVTKRGITRKIPLSPTGRYSVRAARITETELNYSGTVVDDVSWREMYATAPVTGDFGDITTIQVMTRASSINANTTRKFNCVASRLINIIQVTNNVYSLSNNLQESSKATDILSFICCDPYIGNRPLNQLDLQNFYETYTSIVEYFGSSKAAEFNYSFDKANISFEETIEAIASTIFSVAYRRGSQIKLSFEKATSNSILLFNHRNKIPGSETRSVRFGVLDDNDGVEFTYVDFEADNDNAKLSLTLPEDGSSVNPKKVESIGITNRLQAYFHVHRTWNKLRYQNTTVEFEGTQESNMLLLNDRILVSDGTRPGTLDGEVIDQGGLILTLSRNVTFELGQSYVIFLQYDDGLVESISCTAQGGGANLVALSQAPRRALSLEDSNYARTTFLLTKVDDTRRQTAFLVTERTPSNRGYTASIRGVNYDARYYDSDLDFVNKTVDERGNVDATYASTMAVLESTYGSTDGTEAVLNQLSNLTTNWPIDI